MRTLSVLAMSDLHGYLPSFATGANDAALTAALRKEFRRHDVAIIAGDVVPATSTFHVTAKDGLLKQVRWIHDTFIPWLYTIPARHIVMTWGNHDWFADQRGGSLVHPEWYPDHCHVLVNDGVTLNGVHYYGVPQTPRFFDWAFNEEDTREELGRRWEAVDAHTDILVTHGPPHGTVDRVGSRRCGSTTQFQWLWRNDGTPRPRAVFCGHIHASGGTSVEQNGIVVYNVALINEQYRPVRDPVSVELTWGWR